MPYRETRDLRAVQEKFAKWHQMMVNDNVHFNAQIAHHRDLHNPNIAHTLLQYLNLDEFGTNFDRSRVSLISDEQAASLDYEAIAAKQRSDWEARFPTHDQLQQQRHLQPQPPVRSQVNFVASREPTNAYPLDVRRGGSTTTSGIRPRQ